MPACYNFDPMYGQPFKLIFEMVSVFRCILLLFCVSIYGFLSSFYIMHPFWCGFSQSHCLPGSSNIVRSQVNVFKRRRTLFQHMTGTLKPKCGFMREVQSCGKCKVPKTGALILVHLQLCLGAKTQTLCNSLGRFQNQHSALD